MFKIYKNSIVFNLAIMFIVVIVLVITSFLFLLKNNYKIKEMHVGKKYHPIIRMIAKECHLNGTIGAELEDELGNLNIKIIKSKILFDNIIQNGKLRFQPRDNEHIRVKILEYENINYLDVKIEQNHFLLKDENEIESNEYFIILIFLIILVSLFFVFFTTLKKLYAIKELHQKVTKLGDEEFDFSGFDATKKDEISLLAQEFILSSKKLKEIKEARNIFIRNIMHELKTPITKGKFLLELPNNTANKALMQKVFYRLESLINEFASVEELLAAKSFDTKEYFLADIIDNAIDLMIDIENEVRAEMTNEKISVMFKLFSIAIKNLLDNGLKYSTSNIVNIVASKEKIEVMNYGKPLRFPLEYYFEPFRNENANNDSFGLGLYITNHILKAHNFGFSYKYEDEKNIFTIKL